MNNLRLLGMLLCAASASCGAVTHAQTVVTLEEIFQSAEKGSNQLRSMISAQKETEKDIAVAKSALLPDINAGLTLSFIGDGFTTKRNYTDYQVAKIPHLGTGLNINVNQPVYTGGALKNAIEMAEMKSTASRFATDLSRMNIRFELTGYYLEIYKCHNLQRVVESNIEAAERMLRDMQARYKQGTVLNNDITRYELLLSNLRLQKTKLENTRLILNNNLVTLASLPENTIVEPDTTILQHALPLNGESWWKSEAIIHSPTLKLSLQGIEMCKKAEQIVKSERLPKVGLQAGWTMDGPILVEVPPINRNLSYWWIGVGVDYNISSLYKSNKSLAKAHAAITHAVDEYDVAKEGIEMGIRADYIKYLEAYEELKTQEKSVELANKNYKTTSTRYSADMALITDMLDAANSRLDAEQQLVNARINILYYYYKLLFTSGKI
ncbi:MAG: TolC family protein [Muribaculaceae bacterium]|nr:TolC family protein [Muribaculaceae bacterium]